MIVPPLPRKRKQNGDSVQGNNRLGVMGWVRGSGSKTGDWQRFDNATALEYLEWLSLPLQISTSLDGLNFGRSDPICRPTAATMRQLTGLQQGLFLLQVEFETRYYVLKVSGPL